LNEILYLITFNRLLGPSGSLVVVGAANGVARKGKVGLVGLLIGKTVSGYTLHICRFVANHFWENQHWKQK